MINSSVLRNIFFIVILHISSTVFCQDTIYRFNKSALIGIIKQENAESVHISVFKNGRIKEKVATKEKIISLKRGNTNGYFVFDSNGALNKTAFKKKEKTNWKNIKNRERSLPDTLKLIDRKPINRMFVGVKYDSLEGNLLYYRKPGRTKIRSMELEKIYSVNYSTKKPPLILYIQDTLEGNWYTVEQMGDYMQGQDDAYKNYKKKARLASVNGFLVGLASPAIDDRFGPFIIVGYTGLVGFSKPKLKTKYGFDINYKDNPYYAEGFGTMAKRLTLWHSATATVSGYILGSVGLIFLVN
jgi:hypothetical protein